MTFKKILSWVISPLHILFFFLILLLFHPIHVAAHLLGGGRLGHRTLELMCLCLLLNMRFLGGTKIRVTFEAAGEIARPTIFVSNHQSMYDLPLLIWHLRRYSVRFIAKKELGRWLPSISYALRHLNFLLIDRRSPRSAITALEGFGKNLSDERGAACIFPEGTRARDGRMKPFKAAGLMTLLETCPSAVIVPVAIDGSWELLRHNFLPMPYGVTVKCSVLSPLERNRRGAAELIEIAEARIRECLRQPEEQQPPTEQRACESHN